MASDNGYSGWLTELRTRVVTTGSTSVPVTSPTSCRSAVTGRRAPGGVEPAGRCAVDPRWRATAWLAAGRGTTGPMKRAATGMTGRAVTGTVLRLEIGPMKGAATGALTGVTTGPMKGAATGADFAAEPAGGWSLAFGLLPPPWLLAALGLGWLTVVAARGDAVALAVAVGLVDAGERPLSLPVAVVEGGLGLVAATAVGEVGDAVGDAVAIGVPDELGLLLVLPAGAVGFLPAGGLAAAGGATARTPARTPDISTTPVTGARRCHARRTVVLLGLQQTRLH